MCSKQGLNSHLNTSHVLIYLSHHSCHFSVIYTFKYISCSYLSNKKVTKGYKKLYLNTSHVLIYL